MMGKKTETSFRGILLGLTGASMVLGVILLTVGSVVVSGYSVYLDFITGRYLESAVFILVMGIVVVTVSAIGFYAALKSHYCMMTTFLIIMVLAILCELIAAVTTFALNGEKSHEMGMRKKLKESLDMYGSPTSPQQTKSWDLIQTELHCCGLNDVNDYSRSSFTNQTGYLPESCCGPLQLDKFGEPEKCRPDTPSRHKAGCVIALKSLLVRKVGVVGAMAVIVAIVQITIIVGASVLVSKWKVPGQCYPCY
eukprot:GFUD01138537.1.p1 GENE.GFUD01138537.1~~GFUD01138537.1.p1  ORF type:complete len:252 (-),score=71.17 GFUD01138537.1:30-785(-)